jgi:hypothetical protein
MTDLLENVGLLVALMLVGVGTTYVVLIMCIKAFDYLENGHDRT